MWICANVIYGYLLGNQSKISHLDFIYMCSLNNPVYHFIVKVGVHDVNGCELGLPVSKWGLWMPQNYTSFPVYRDQFPLKKMDALKHGLYSILPLCLCPPQAPFTNLQKCPYLDLEVHFPHPMLVARGTWQLDCECITDFYSQFLLVLSQGKFISRTIIGKSS